MSSLATRIKAVPVRRMRAALVRRVREEPRPERIEGADRRVFFLLMTAYGLGGTIRTTFNLAEYLASTGWDVTIISIGRHRNKPFFPFPEGVKVEVLDDKRPDSEPSWRHPVKKLLRYRSSVLIHPRDRGARGFNAWVDIKLVQRLRGESGILIGTRPGLNLVAAKLRPPGLVLIGQEHMNLREHPQVLQQAMRRGYRKLDLVTTLTDLDHRRHAKNVGRRTPVVTMPNTVRDMGDVTADLSAKTVLTAGRLSRQKAYDRLIKAWEEVAPTHPDWRLRICGEGPKREMLERMIAERGLEGSISLEKPAKNMGKAMSKASIFVLSSRFEGLPLVLLEAMSVGMGVVSFDCPTGPRDVIEDRVNGLLVQRRIAFLAEALSEMMDDEDLRRRCSAGAVETARRYRMEVIGPRWEELLSETWQAHRQPAVVQSRGVASEVPST